MIDFFKKITQYKYLISLHLVSLITLILAIVMTLGIDQLINIEKSIIVSPHYKLKSDSVNNYQFQIKQAYKTDTVFMTLNNKRFYFISCLSYLKKVCDEINRISEQKFKIQEIDFIRPLQVE